MGAVHTDRRMVLPIRQGEEWYGVYARDIREVIRLPKLTEIPGQPPWLLGLFVYKGKVAPALSLAALTAGGAGAREPERICLLLRLEDGGLIGLAVTRAGALIPEGRDELEFDKAHMERGLVKLSRVLRGARTVFLLDVARTAASLRVTGAGDGALPQTESR